MDPTSLLAKYAAEFVKEEKSKSEAAFAGPALPPHLQNQSQPDSNATKRKFEPTPGSSLIPAKLLKKTVTMQVASAAPMKPKLAAVHQLIPSYVANPNDKIVTQTGKSYQEALKSSDSKAEPKYVFPSRAPQKASAASSSSSSGTGISPYQQSNGGGGNSSSQTGNSSQSSAQSKKEKEDAKYKRKAGGIEWEDTTLAEWDESDHRIFVGDLGNEANDDLLTRAFNKYPSFQRAKVLRDKKSGKSRGYGFVSFKDSADYAKALREMNGKYIGNRPCKLTKSKWKDRALDQ
eukprot:TRINITY_DN3188_c0_g1_i3.p2 TRINITY_DN3188_c0_g1~~TRINITY_DN3188_c0_g1_i3.p2  ORF type:complete len:290 (+),score=122.02 TRINITY_DN3188_c0_g1_i3:81-950(+)